MNVWLYILCMNVCMYSNLKLPSIHPKISKTILSHCHCGGGITPTHLYPSLTWPLLAALKVKLMLRRPREDLVNRGVIPRKCLHSGMTAGGNCWDKSSYNFNNIHTAYEVNTMTLN